MYSGIFVLRFATLKRKVVNDIVWRARLIDNVRELWSGRWNCDTRCRGRPLIGQSVVARTTPTVAASARANVSQRVCQKLRLLENEEQVFGFHSDICRRRRCSNGASASVKLIRTASTGGAKFALVLISVEMPTYGYQPDSMAYPSLPEGELTNRQVRK